MNQKSRSESVCESGQKCVRERDFAKAIELFSRALAEEDGNVEAHEGLATAFFLSGEFEKSRDEFDRATKLDPERGRALINMGAVCNRLGDHKTAASVLRRGLQKEKNSSQGYYNLGIAQKALNQLTMAISAYREAIRIDPQMAEAHQNLGNTYLEMGNQRQAIQSFKKALEARPGFDRAERALRTAEQAMQKAKQAFGPFGRLVDERALASGKAVARNRELTPQERFGDRQYIRKCCTDTREAATQWQEILDGPLMSSLRELDRVIVQSEGSLAVSSAFQELGKSVRALTTTRQQLVECIRLLKRHDDKMKA